jgi:hypothetical protein
MVRRGSAGHDRPMDTLIALAGPALAILAPITIALAIRNVGGDDFDASLPLFLRPLASGVAQDSSRPVVPETEPVAWNLDRLVGGSPAA